MGPAFLPEGSAGSCDAETHLKQRATLKKATKKKATKKKATKKKATKKKATKRDESTAGSHSHRKSDLPHVLGVGLRGFKCFENLPTIRFAPITVLTGPNSCGKSTIVQALVLLKQSLEATTASSPLVFDDMVNLGSAQRVLTAGSELGEFSIDLEIHAPPYWDEPAESSDSLDWLISLSFEPAADDCSPTRLKRISVSTIDRELVMTISPHPGGDGIATQYGATIHSKRIGRAIGEGLKELDLRIAPSARVDVDGFIPSLIEAKRVGAKEKVMLPLQFVRPSLGRVFAALRMSLTRNLAYIGPLRTEPTDVYVQSTKRIGVRGENCVSYLRAHQEDHVQGGMPDGECGTLLACVNAWLLSLRASSGIRFESLGDLHFEALTGESRHLNEVGCGVGQLLPVVVQCLAARGDEVVLLEQPEIHLHQQLQAGLADLILARKDNGVRFVVETHSEIFIQRLRRRIAESDDDSLSSDISVFFGEDAQFVAIKIDRNGAVDVWPEQFFDQGLKELRAMSMAVSGDLL